MSPGQLNFFFQHYVFPVEFILGWSGNILNLIVLLSRGMRTKTNMLLASMAFADLAFLLVMAPHSAITFQSINHTRFIHIPYHNYRPTLTGLANWFSVASTWFVATVCIERWIAIKMPLHVKRCWRGHRLSLTIMAIFLFSFIVTFHYHMTYYFPHNNQNNQTIPQVPVYAKVATVIQAVVHIVIPFLVLVVTNVALVVALRTQREDLVRVGSSSQYSNNAAEQLRKVTLMVVTIVTCFIVTNVPSMVVHLWELFDSKVWCCSWVFWYSVFFANSLVITGKVLNFFLFCTSSRHFRQQLTRVVGRKKSIQQQQLMSDARASCV